MFASRILFFAKVSIKEANPAAKKKAISAANKDAVVKKKRDNTIPRPQAFNLYQLIHLLPSYNANFNNSNTNQKNPPNPSDSSIQLHKNGFGLKFYRQSWAKYQQPSYWMITKFKPITHNHKEKAWGILTWYSAAS
jgi:hypothetical protein